jgi:hypothetical protein
LLISPDFLASDYCYSIELRKAMERHEAGEARVIPILLRPVADWDTAPFAVLLVDRVEKSIIAVQTPLGPVLGDETVKRGFLLLESGSLRALLRVASLLCPPHATAPHLAAMPLKPRAAARATRAPGTPSIVEGFCQLPAQESLDARGAPSVCPLARAAARALLLGTAQDAQQERRPATTPDELIGRATAAPSPTCGVRERLLHGRCSDGPAHYRRCSPVHRGLIPLRRLGAPPLFQGPSPARDEPTCALASCSSPERRAGQALPATDPLSSRDDFL